MTGFRSAYLRIALLAVLSCATFATTAIQTSHIVMAFEIDDDGHEGITRDALKGIFRTLPSGAGAVQFSEKALEEIADANEDIDNYQTSPAMHFDGERFVEGANRLYVLRENVIKALAKDVPDGKTAREELGHALHTLQDFYAHSNWVDLQKQGIPLPKPAGLSRTELDSTKVFSHKAFCPIASDELDLTVPALTSGYFGWTPAGKCDHGFDQLRIKNGGIAKDTLWLSQPDKSLHQAAKDAAKSATTDFIKNRTFACAHKMKRQAHDKQEAVCGIPDQHARQLDMHESGRAS